MYIVLKLQYYVGIAYYLVLFVQTLKTLKWNQSKTQRLKRTFYRPVPPKKFKIFCPPPKPGTKSPPMVQLKQKRLYNVAL